MKLYIDGIDGVEIPWLLVPTGNKAFQYALGTIDGCYGVYRRKECERGTYGGWRWECYPSHCVGGTPSIA